MIMSVHFSRNSRPSEYVDNPGRAIFKKGDTYRSGSIQGKIVLHGVENIGGILQKFIEVNIEVDEPWIEVMPKQEPKKIENAWDSWVRSEKHLPPLSLEEMPSFKQHTYLEIQTETPNFHEK